jgi:lipopolysaccharide export LptBFGC system permease protein LptF
VAYVAQPNEDAYTVTAENGELFYHEGVPNLLLYNGNRQVLGAENQKLSILFFDQTAIALKPSKKIVGPRGRKMYEMTIAELVEASKSEDWREKRYYAEIAQRLLVPWYALTFSGLALLFLLLRSFTRIFQISSVLCSVVAVVALESLTLLLINLGAHSWIALGGAYVLQLFTILTSSYLLMRKR